MKTKLKLLVIVLLFFSSVAPLLMSQTCDEKDVFEIDRIKQEVETMLVTATTAETTLNSGEKLLAFYKDGRLIKISVDNSNNDGPYFSAELFFRDGFIKHISEEYSKSGKFYKDCYYFVDDKLICYTGENFVDYKSAEKYAKAEKKWLKKIEKYLEAIQ